MSIPRSLERGLATLELALRHPAGISFSEVQAALGLPNATVNRLLISLCGLEYLEKEHGVYRPGVRLAQVGARETADAFLRRCYLCQIEELAGCTGCTTLLVQWTGHHAVCLERVMRPGSTPMVRRGYVTRDILSSPWGVFFLSGAGWRREIRAASLPAPAAARAMGHYREEQARLLESGFTFGHTPERQRIAAPIRGKGERVIGAVALGIGPAFRPDRDLYELGARVRDAAAEPGADGCSMWE